MDKNSKYHVLLIGVDAYPVKPLYGCVNDIDGVQKMLVERVRIPVGDIKRLASPHPGAKHETAVQEKPATLANMREAFAALGSNAVGPTDRVFVYYSGHGGRVPVSGPQGISHRESLVPIDFRDDPKQPRLLLDFELNRLLGTIARRTSSVTVVLDCCHSTGATREVLVGQDVLTRRLVFPDDLDGNVTVSLPESSRGDSDDSTEKAGVDDCQVVAACLNHELAKEQLDSAGVRHGLLTAALMTLLKEVDEAELQSVPWARIWERMRDHVETANPSQHLWMAGSFGRAVLAGPPVKGDAGFTLRTKGADLYEIDAGTLAEVNVGAKLAVYKDRPLFFPSLGTPEDAAARVSPSLLRVISAERGRAVAQAEPAPFDLPPGARARVVAPGPAERLACAAVPQDAKLVAELRKSELLQVVDEREARVLLKRRPDGAWDLNDDVAGAKPEYPPLVTLQPNELDLARLILELYSRYALPIRMATRCVDLPGQLQVKFLACSEDGLPEDVAATAELTEVPRHKSLDYALQVGTTFCIEVRNASIRQLRVAVVNCAATGRVEFLGDQSIDPRSSYRFWNDNQLGKPFEATAGDDGAPYIDRLVVIGTTLLDQDLRYLKSDKAFADLLVRTRTLDGSKGLTGGGPARPVEKWTATQLLLGVGL